MINDIVLIDYTNLALIMMIYHRNYTSTQTGQRVSFYHIVNVSIKWRMSLQYTQYICYYFATVQDNQTKNRQCH